MPQHAVPAETDILCAHCGYALNGLPQTGLCPECGQPIADSTTADPRTLPPWETTDGTATQRFLSTTKQVITNPATFFRTLATRGDENVSRGFADAQHWLSAALLGIASAFHMDLFWSTTVNHFALIAALPLVMITWAMLKGITKLASYLTRLEGTFWGYRMPQVAVRRAMHYHSAQLLPVAVASFLLIVGYRILAATGIVSVMSQVPYLYTLSVLVVVAALYLFRTYWIAMKNIMYANR